MSKLFSYSMVFSSLLGSIQAGEELRASDVSPFEYSLAPMISYPEIADKIQQFSAQLQQDYQNEEICVIAVLKGSLWFVTDLMKTLKMPAILNTISCSSYGEGGIVAKELAIQGLEKLRIQDKHVIIVDDICDTGNTLIKLKAELKKLSPKSIKTAVLLLKETERSLGYEPDYHLFKIEDRFVVGYGLDYKEYYRGLPGIYLLGYSDAELR